MTIESAVSKAKYIGNGETVSFAVPFKFLKNLDGSSQIAVYSGEDSVLLKEGTDYTVSGAGNNGGGEVLFKKAPASGELIVIIRSIPVTQKTRFIEGEDFPASEFEESLDKITMLIQEQKETISRAVVLKPTSDQDPGKLLYDTIESVNEAMSASQEASDAAKEAKTAAETAEKIAIEAVSTINTARDDAVAVVEDKGSEQSVLVAAEGEKQKKEIGTEAAEAISAIASSGENQTNLVSQAGAEQIELVKSEGQTQIALAADQAAAAAASAAKAETHATNAAESANLAQTSANAAEQSSSSAATIVNSFDTHAAGKQTAFDSHVTQKTTEAAAAVTAEGEKQIGLAAEQTEEARKWAVGTIEEQPAGSSKHWAEVAKGQVIPDQTGQDGKFLTTDGEKLSWGKATNVQIEYLD